MAKIIPMSVLRSSTIPAKKQSRQLLIHSDIYTDRIVRPIHYLGSKLRMLDFIQNAVDAIDRSAGVCDLFAGSGCVSHKLSFTHNVTSVDIQEYSKVICSALLEPIQDDFHTFIDSCLFSEHKKMLDWAVEPMMDYEMLCIERDAFGNSIPLCELIEQGSIIAFESGYTQGISKDLSDALKETVLRLHSNKHLNNAALTIKYFGGLFFSYRQAADIDNLLEGSFSLKNKKKNTYLAAILSTTSEIVNTVGKQFAQPIRPRKSDGTTKLNLGRMVNKDRKLDTYSIFEGWIQYYTSLKESGQRHVVHKMDYSDALDILTDNTKIIYADPPYTRDHYSRFYHVLETLCLRDNPQISKSFANGNVSISRGMYRENRHQSAFCIKSEAPFAFEKLFSKARNLEASLLLSYSPYDESKKSHPRLLTIERLKDMAKKYYKHVEITTPGEFSHSKLNSVDRHLESSQNAELIIICRPN